MSSTLSISPELDCSGINHLTDLNDSQYWCPDHQKETGDHRQVYREDPPQHNLNPCPIPLCGNLLTLSTFRFGGRFLIGVYLFLHSEHGHLVGVEVDSVDFNL